MYIQQGIGKLKSCQKSTIRETEERANILDQIKEQEITWFAMNYG